MAPLGTAMKQFERAYLIRTLAEFGDKKGKAAESLGISRKNLWEKLRMHGIASPDAPGFPPGNDSSVTV
jgi:DNA-binding NtrC family response regulator